MQTRHSSNSFFFRSLSVIILSFCLLTPVLVPAPLSAQTVSASIDGLLTPAEREFLAGAPTVNMCFIPNRAPYSSVGRDGELSGICVDIIDWVSGQTGIAFHYLSLNPGERVVAHLEGNPDHLVCGVLVTNPQFVKERFVTTESFYSEEVVLVALDGANALAGMQDETCKVAMPRSYAALELFVREYYPNFEVVFCDTLKECFDLVVHGKAVFAMQNLSVVKPYLSMPRYERLSMLPVLFMKEEMGCVGLLTPENELLSGILNKCFAAMPRQVLGEIVLRHTVQSTYRLTLGDVLFKYRGQLLLLVTLLLGVVAVVMVFLRQKNDTLKELARVNTQLEDAVAQASDASQVKSHFLARISHDIRTPMHAITGQLDLIEIAERNHTATAESRLEAIDRVRRAAWDMERMVEDVIRSSTELEGGITLRKDVFHPRGLVLETAKEFQMALSSRVAWISTDIPESKYPALLGDRHKLRSLYENLLEFVLCVQSPLRSVVVRYRENSIDEGNVYVTLAVELVLARPANLDDASDTKLTLIQNSADLLGGALTVHTPNDIRCNFSVTVPLWLSDDDSMELPVNAPKVSEPVNLNEIKRFDKGHMLVVEDNEVNAHIMQHLFETCGVTSEHAWNGREAVNLFEKSAPGTYTGIFMDIRMPVMSGIDASLTIRTMERPDALTVPIYAVSANYTTSDVSMSFNAGMNGHVKKPIDTGLLFKILKELCG